MELSKERTDANIIRAWEQGRVRVGADWLSGNLIITADRIVTDWRVADPRNPSIDELAPAIELEPEIILLGTGDEVRLPDVTLMAALAELHIGLEIMNTPSACRTFNVLLHEQRRVAAALLG